MKDLKALPYRSIAEQQKMCNPAFSFFPSLCGIFEIPLPSKLTATVVADNGISDQQWEHISVSIWGTNRCLTWKEMCFIKDFFWKPEEIVIQYHPPKSDYVNIAENCLHLWKPKFSIPTPDFSKLSSSIFNTRQSLPLPGKFTAIIRTATFSSQWEVASVSMNGRKGSLPTWMQMVHAKMQTFGPDATVMQFHAPVDTNLSGSLNLWKYCGSFPRPLANLVR